MRRIAWMLLVILLAAGMVAAQPAAPQEPCGRVDGARTVDASLPAVGGVAAAGGNQRIEVSWEAADGVAGYRVSVFQESGAAHFETSSTACRITAVNGRTYAVQVAAIGPDGSIGPTSAPVGVEPEFQQDFLLLATGLLTVWLGIWGYAIILVRAQSRVARGYEALFKKGDSGAEP